MTETFQIAWGDSRSTHRLALADGRVFAARHLSAASARERADELVRRFDRLARSGIAIAGPVELHSVAEGEIWLLAPWIDGATGAEALQDPGSAVRLANAMGHLSSQIAGVDLEGLDVDRSWAGPGPLAASGAEWFREIETALAPATRLSASRSLDEVVAAWDQGSPWQVGTSHGDFAPINVIVDPRGALVLLDLDQLQVGPRLLDLAWWGWVVRYHHPEAWAAAWPSLIAGARLDGGPPLDRDATAVARLRLAERAASAPDPATRTMWLARLEQTADW